MSTYQLVTEAAELVEFCKHARQFSSIVLDTEFVRVRTYYARLGLIQVRAGEQTVLIDPVGAIDLSSLWELLHAEDLEVVIHAGGEDFEILAQAMGQPLRNVFDTQIAAAFAGLGDALGYAALVEQLTGVVLDKSQSRTDWLQRPLAPEQLDYAAADVDYLQQVYPALLSRLSENPLKLDLTVAESAFQVEKRTQQWPADLLYLQFGNAWQCTPKQLAVLREVLQWRLERAREADIPLSFVAKDHTVLELARQHPVKADGLYSITDLSPVTRRYAGKKLVMAIQRGLEVPLAEQPERLSKLTDMQGYKPAFNALKKAVDAYAKELDVTPSLIGSRRQLNDVIHWFWQIPAAYRSRLPVPDLLVSWRGAKLKATIESLLNRD
ncbi:ribonuclease D [Pseudidiomarina aestuarii]|uniref:Ribonuclease D n=1 Tax=Pseudidiomarina aestuarii TaxID=624146 RepID=A0A6N4DD24_9GAMM|nr:ribonuclease D [Pseudidiomarina aestuarii]